MCSAFVDYADFTRLKYNTEIKTTFLKRHFTVYLHLFMSLKFAFSHMKIILARMEDYFLRVIGFFSHMNENFHVLKLHFHVCNRISKRGNKSRFMKHHVKFASSHVNSTFQHYFSQVNDILTYENKMPLVKWRFSTSEIYIFTCENSLFICSWRFFFTSNVETMRTNRKSAIC